MTARQHGAAGYDGVSSEAAVPDRRALHVDGLSIYSGRSALVKDVSFTIGAGERVGIIGASGSGKTLTCLAVAGLIPETLRVTGSIRYGEHGSSMVGAAERDWAQLRGRAVGMVFQEPMTALNPTMRIGRQVAEAIRLHHRSAQRAAVRAHVRALLVTSGLPDPGRVARAYPHELSGGQRQRVVIAIALANSPDLLICDEPTTALDVRMQAKVLALIDERVTDVNAGLMFVSHDLAVVAGLCDRVLVLDRGHVVESGPVPQVLRRPEAEATQRLLAEARPRREVASWASHQQLGGA